MNAKAIDIQLNTDDVIQIESIIAKYPNTRERYPESAMSMMNKLSLSKVADILLSYRHNIFALLLN